MISKFLSARDKFMPEICLRQPGFTQSVSGPFTKNKERIKKFKETGDSRYICENELDKACFQHDMTYGDFKDLIRRTTANKVLCNKAFDIAKDLKHDDKHITTPEFNKLTSENFVARLAQGNLANRNDIANFVNKTDFNRKILGLNKRIDSN